jgi:glyoxylase I family protein
VTTSPIRPGAPTHIRLTVTDVPRAQAFWTDVLGFETAVAGPPEDDDGTVAEALQGGVVMAGRGVRIGLRPVDRARAGDRFDPFRVGLDHLSLAVETRAELDEAVEFLDAQGVPHGPIRTAMGGAFLAFFDPDGIAVELTAPPA